MVVSKLSKLLNQEDALSAPCLRGDLCSPQAPSRDARILWKGVIRRFRRHILVCYTEVIMPAGADAFAVVGGGCAGRMRRCKAKQNHHGKTALTSMLTSSVTLVLELLADLADFFGNHGSALFWPFGAVMPSIRAGVSGCA